MFFCLPFFVYFEELKKLNCDITIFVLNTQPETCNKTQFFSCYGYMPKLLMEQIQPRS